MISVTFSKGLDNLDKRVEELKYIPVNKLAQIVKNKLAERTKSKGWRHGREAMTVQKVSENTSEIALNGKYGLIYTFLHRGTKPHPIQPISALALRFKVDGATVFAKKVNHPGTPAFNWFTVDNEIMTEVKSEVETYVKKTIG